MLDFGDVVRALKEGKTVRRTDWDKAVWLLLIKGESVRTAINDNYGDPETTGIPVLDSIYLKTSDDKLVPWLPSQSDILAEDWSIN